MQIQMYDRGVLDKSANIRKTNDGYLVAMPRVARTGIQLYKGDEVGMPQMDVVRVYRPEEEVFNKDSLATYGHKPVTNDHPRSPVTPKNWRDVSVGSIDGEVLRDGQFIRVPMLVMDGKAIEDVENGKMELSVGYSTELKWEKGTTPGGEQYDAIQTGIRVNHVAIVDAARGGSKLKIGDQSAPDPNDNEDADDQGDSEMSDASKNPTIIQVDGISCTMDAMVAGIVSKALKDAADKLNAATSQVATLTAQAATDKAAHDAAIAKLTTESKTALDAANAKVATLEQQVKDAALTPDKLEKLVADRAEMLGKAKAILGDKLVTDKKTDAEIKRQVVDAKLGDAAKGWTDDQVNVAFATLSADVKFTPAAGVIDTARAFAQGGNQPNWSTQDGKNKAYAEADKKLSARWQSPGGVKAA